MFKTNAPLQIRLTEPVIFLRGPSTGLDGRGRPQIVRNDGQPAMLRGLLTLRLSKPTRIRSISIQFTGKARTEWPEGTIAYSLSLSLASSDICLMLAGIGLRRMDTHEEHILLSETVTYFSSRDRTASRSRSTRRAISLGPGITLSQWDFNDEDLDDNIVLHGVPDENADMSDWVAVSRRDRDDIFRSSIATSGRRGSIPRDTEGFPRRPSTSSTDGLPAFGPHEDREFNASPAYTPYVEPFPVQPRQSSLRQSTSPMPSREPVLSPIASAAPSRAGSDRDASAETQQRRLDPTQRDASLSQGGAEYTSSRWLPQIDDFAVEDENVDDNASPLTQPISENPSHRPMTGEVHFAGSVRASANSEEDASHPNSLANELPTGNRAASVRTMHSAFSASSVSLSTPPHEHSSAEIHPTVATVQTASAESPESNSPILPPGILRDRTAHEASPGPDPFPPLGDGRILSEHRVTTANGSSRRSSLISRDSAGAPFGTTAGPSPHRSFSELPEVRPGRKSRLSNGASIVPNNGSISGPSTHRPLTPEPYPQESERSERSTSGTFSLATHGSNRGSSIEANRQPSEDGRDRRASRFSLSAALRGLNKGRLSSKSQTRGDESRIHGPTEASPPNLSVHTARSRRTSGLAIPRHLISGERTGRQIRSESTGQADDFVASYGRDGARRRGEFGETTESLTEAKEETNENRGRGRNKGMKVLTGAFGLSMNHYEDREDADNWKEFRKGELRFDFTPCSSIIMKGHYRHIQLPYLLPDTSRCSTYHSR